MYYTDDPVADFHRWDADQQAKLDRLPCCCECDQPITDETYFEINGECICKQCLIDNHEKNTADFIQ